MAASTSSFTLRGQAVPVTSEPSVSAESVALALASQPFTSWLETIEGNPAMDVQQVHVQSVDLFGPRVGFVKFRANVMVDGVQVPGIVFMRGGSVAVLLVLRCGGREWTILTRQPRTPLGLCDFPEIPAGMLDGDGNLAGVAAKELREETELEIPEAELTDLCAEFWGDRFPGMVPSGGGCDEFIRLFCCEKDVPAAQLAQMQGRLTGLREEGELIKLQVVPLDELHLHTPDAKSLSAHYLYTLLQARRQPS